MELYRKFICSLHCLAVVVAVVSVEHKHTLDMLDNQQWATLTMLTRALLAGQPSNGSGHTT